jgi:cyclopropane-fatty-acyl-phospholipid synthase
MNKILKNKILQLLEILNNCQFGSLEITLPDGGVQKFFADESIQANLKIHHWSSFLSIFSKGDIGFAEEYIKCNLESDDLESLLNYIAINHNSLEKIYHGSWINNQILKVIRLFQNNNLKNSKTFIKKHYDLGNDFYKLWLDDSLTYSSAIFNSENESLANGQQNKYCRIIEKLKDCESQKEILEVGSGWGGFAKLATQHNFNVTGLSLSKEQITYCRELINTHNLDKSFKVKLQDYRHEKGVFDNIVSIEMFEAVGQKYWPEFFKMMQDCLKQKGTAIIQTITIDHQYFKKYSKQSDFIQQYIFPGGMLPSSEIFEDLVKKHKFEIVSTHSFGADYARTLQIWKKNFLNNLSKIRSQGFDNNFIRKWEFYLCYCIAGFKSKRTDVKQFEFRKI